MRTEDYARFMAWLDPDPERAGVLYIEVQRKLTLYFLGRRCGVRAEELAAMVLDRTAEKFSDGRQIEDREPGRYIFQVARYVLLEFYKKNLTEPLPPEIPAASPLPKDERTETACWKECLEGLSEEDRHLLQDYYQGEKKGEGKRIRGEIAGDFGVQPGALRIRVYRLKKRLLDCMAGCVKRAGAAGT